MKKEIKKVHAFFLDKNYLFTEICPCRTLNYLKNKNLYVKLIVLVCAVVIGIGILSLNSYAASCSYSISGQPPSKDNVREYVKTVYDITTDIDDAFLDNALEQLIFKETGINYFKIFGLAMKADEVACHLLNHDYDEAALAAVNNAATLTADYVIESLGIGSVFSVATLATLPIELSLNYFKNNVVQIARNNQTKMYIKARLAGISHEDIISGATNDDLLFTDDGWLYCVIPAGICFSGLQAVEPVGYNRDDIYGMAKQIYDSYIDATRFKRDNDAIGQAFAKQFVPNISHVPQNPEFADDVTFAAAGRMFNEMNIVAYSWDFGDGSTAAGKTVSHRYKIPKSYTVTLVALDSNGQSHQYTTSIYVAPPRIIVGYPNGYEDKVRHYTTANKTCGDHPSPCVTQYAWNFGDGIVETDDDNVKNHTYTEAGSYNVTLTLTLDDGATVQGSTSIFVGPGTRYINGHTIYGEETWYSGGTYVIQGNITVAQGATLTIEPGTVIKFANQKGITVSGTLAARGTEDQRIVFTSVLDNNYGGDTDTLAEYLDHPDVGDTWQRCPECAGDGSCYAAANYWGQIDFSSTSENSIIDRAIILWGGSLKSTVWCYNPYATGMLSIRSSSVSVTNSLIYHSWGSGVNVTNASPTLTGNTITGNASSGIGLNSSNAIITSNTISNNGGPGIIAQYTSCPTIVGNTITGNSGYGMYFDSTSGVTGVGENTSTGNNPNNGIFIASWTLTKNSTLIESGSPYVTGSITVPEGITLTIEPGTVVKLRDQAYINVSGTLIADGTAENPIVFTSVWDNDFGGDTDPSHSEGHPTEPGTQKYTSGGSTYTAYNMWASIKFSSTSTNSIIDHAIVRYGGYHYTYSVPGNLEISSSSVTVSNSEISHGRTSGAYVTNASPTLTGNTITGNASHGINVSANSGGSYNGNMIAGNSAYGLYYSGTTLLDATGSYWGDPSGPLDNSDDRASGGLYNPNGKGNRVSNYVNYDPWTGKGLIKPVVPSPPTTASIGGTITLNGSYFGVTQGSGYVDFNGVRGIIVSWSDTQIIVQVPPGATTGCMKVVTDYGESECIDFTVNENVIYATYPDAGIWKNDGSEWSQITTGAPVLMVTSGTDLYATFAGGGIWKYNGTDWSQATSNNPDKMVVSGTTLYGTFTGNGIWKFDGTNWSQVTSNNPDDMVIAGGSLYGTFGTSGVWKYDGSDWSQITTNTPRQMVGTTNALYGIFEGSGIWKYEGTEWTQVTSNTPEQIISGGTNLYGTFAGSGIWKYNGTDWSNVTPNNPEQMTATSTALYGVFTGTGIWKYDGTSWSQVTSNDPLKMVAGE